MGIKKSRGLRLHNLNSVFSASKHSIRASGRRVKALAMVESEEGEGEPSEGRAAPEEFLGGKALRDWNRLTKTARRHHVMQAEQKTRQAKRPKGIARGREEEKAAKQAESHVAHAGKQAAGHAAKNIADGAGAAVSATGAGIALQISRKTAEKFKQSRDRKIKVIEQERIRLQSEIMQGKGEDGGAYGTIATLAAASASTAVMAASMAMQAMVAVIMSVLAFLAPVIAIVSIIGAVIALLAVLLTATAGTPFYGNGDIVQVALAEVGTEESGANITKYGQWIGMNGQPWCHSFVSWCGNECGYISAGIMPKTASCEMGRQWYIKRNQYRKASESYVPKAGDIIYFDYGHEGVSHHVGIVEYVENGVVHTVEGNKGDAVRTCHYRLADSAIMGYGQPEYPESGAGSPGNSTQFLSVCRNTAEYIVSEGNWIYISAPGLPKSWEAAIKAEPRRTSCANYVCLCMQRFGTLETGQMFYSNDAGRMVYQGNASVKAAAKKNIERHYDVISAGGISDYSKAGLRAGDICLWNGHTNVYAGKDEKGRDTWYDFGRAGTSDGRPNSGSFTRVMKTGKVNHRLYTVLRQKDQDSYGSGKTIKLPEGMGSVYTYMGWNMVTNKASRQYKLRIRTGENYDGNGFGKIGERYVIACTTTYGKVGDEVDFVLKNGKVIHGVIGDIKNQDDAGCSKWGHQGGKCVVEFCVKKSSWYGTGKTVLKYHPEWGNTTVVKAVNLGRNHLD